MTASYISIRGARENNLKNISLDIPHNKLILVTGVSGSGKSSLAYDVIFKESRRRYLESLSSQSRQYLAKINPPDVDEIKGLRPVISVDQRAVIRNSRSTLATMSGLYDLLRLLMARLGKAGSNISPFVQERRLFSFNTNYGACPACNGLGVEEFIAPELLIKDPDLSLRDGALVITTPSGYTIYSQVTIDVMDKVCRSEGFNVDIPWKDLTSEQKNIVLYGSDKIKIPFGKHSLESRMKWSGITAKPREEGYYKGIIPIMEDILKRDRNKNILRFVKSGKCTHCKGSRLRKEALEVTFNELNIAEISSKTIEELNIFFVNSQKEFSHSTTFQSISKEVMSITTTLIELGLGHLQLNRSSSSLTGGEIQRIRLATQVQNQLSGLLYVFDEPSIGLHSRDQNKLLKLLRQLVNQGNTVIIIEHEQSFIPASDWIIDLGPKAGKMGGELLFNGPSIEFLKENSPNLTRDYYKLYTDKNKTEKKNSHQDKHKRLKIKSADIHNLKNIDTDFIIGGFNVVCGITGSGKSSLVLDCLVSDFHRKITKYVTEGLESFKQIITINQAPIGRTPRSNPATYTKVFDLIRKLFASTEEAKKHGFQKKDFSFNVKGGRCEHCQGAGYQQIGMHFIGTAEIRCEACDGKRFSDDLLQIKYQEKNIFEVLEMEIDSAVEFFKNEKGIVKILKNLQQLGLGYIQLGQSATTLSGGEAQRIKLASEISKNTKGSTLYILNEPTTGLHAYDVEILIKALQGLIENGNSLIVIEHHSEIIKAADHVIELGPESGQAGGEIVFSGSPEKLAMADTLTAKALRHEFDLDINRKVQRTDNNDFIALKGVRTHNLKNISLKIPKNKTTVITGVSGSGKSSLAFDTLFTEGRNQYLQSLPAWVRGRMNNNSAASFDSIKGLTPVLAVNGQKSITSPRSTVGTLSQIYDLYRLLFSRLGTDINGKPCELESSAFSFNNQHHACERCKGLGEIITTDPEKLFTHPTESVLNGAMKRTKTGKFYGDPNGQYVWILKALDEKLGLNLNQPWNNLDEKAKGLVFNGAPGISLEVDWHYKRKNTEGIHQFTTVWQGLSQLINEEYQRKHADSRGDSMLNIMKTVECPACKGGRLNQESLQIKINNTNIHQLSSQSISKALDIFKEWKNSFNNQQLKLSKEIFREIESRLQGLENLELGYLQIDRKSATLSGGEMQRLRIASHIFNRMSGITYVIDEPTIGLHPRNTQNLLAELDKLKQNGNTIVIVEHDSDVIQAADFLIVMGPGGGENGGEIIAKGRASEVLKALNLVGSGFGRIRKGKNPDKNKIEIKSAFANNLKQIDCTIFSGELTGISGVSGSGKSSLMREVIYQSFRNNKAVNCQSIEGLKNFSEAIYIEQNQISANQLSTPLSYLGIFDKIRNIYAKSVSSQKQKVSPKLFSYQSAEGRCAHCNGQGSIKISMDFLSDLKEECPECNGSRYNPRAMEYAIKGKTIADVLQMTFAEAMEFFSDEKSVYQSLGFINELGLGYLKTGQGLDTLSGGESQRLKLAKHLITNDNKPKLFLLDEPSRGLNYKDIEKLFLVFQKLIDSGHTLIMIEHNRDMLDSCHRVIELGPEGGENGGRIIKVIDSDS